MISLTNIDKEYEHSLVGKLLLATPQMGDERFEKAVIFICAHDENGAMGLVLNHEMPEFSFEAMLDQLNIKKDKTDYSEIPVMIGGPVEQERGFLLHGADYKLQDTVFVNDNFSVTASLEGLKSVAQGAGPQSIIFAMGYAGWSEGQLESELKDNAWLVAEANPALIFKTQTDNLWEEAVQSLGIDATFLTTNAGRA